MTARSKRIKIERGTVKERKARKIRSGKWVVDPSGKLLRFIGNLPPLGDSRPRKVVQ